MPKPKGCSREQNWNSTLSALERFHQVIGASGTVDEMASRNGMCCVLLRPLNTVLALSVRPSLTPLHSVKGFGDWLCQCIAYRVLDMCTASWHHAQHCDAT